LALAVAAAGGSWTWFQNDLHAARTRLEGRSTTFESTSGQIEYAEMGDGPPILVSHGSAGGFDHGLEMAAPLAARGYRLIAPSRAGYLRSSMPETFSPDLQADQYKELLDRLGIEKATILAISAGAWSALAFAERYPERCRALVLLVPADRLPEGTKIHGGWISEVLLRSDFAAWVAIKSSRVMPGGLTRVLLGTDARVLEKASPAEKRRVDHLLQHLLPLEPRWSGMRFDIATAAHPPEIALANIACPVLAVSAADDSFGTASRAEQIAKTTPRARFVVYPTGGHALVGRQEETIEVVDDFLRSPPPGPSP
jgi:pimeloyl-ACP methyl ester carboxylesterase